MRREGQGLRSDQRGGRERAATLGTLGLRVRGQEQRERLIMTSAASVCVWVDAWVRESRRNQVNLCVEKKKSNKRCKERRIEGGLARTHARKGRQASVTHPPQTGQTTGRVREREMLAEGQDRESRSRA